MPTRRSRAGVGTSAFFCTWCEERGITRPPDLNRVVIDLYQKWVSRLTRKDGAPLCLHTQALKLQAVSGFCRWLARERLVLSNPAAEMELPRSSVRLPRVVLTAEEAEKVLSVPDVSDPLGLRDRAILETLYSTGIRRSELMRPAVSDVDFRRAVMVVRQGKGRKDRFVPVGERALAWIAKYLRRGEARASPPGTTTAPCSWAPTVIPSARTTWGRWSPGPCSRRTSASAAPATSSATPWRP